MSDYHDELLDHNYDGIQEYDNPMPAWWKAIFLICVIWAGVYVAAITLGYVGTYGVDLKEGVSELERVRQEHAAKQPPINVDEALFTTTIADGAKIALGASVYNANCSACHGDKGQGIIGPNLTDEYWLHGDQPLQMYQIVAKGYVANGMPAWEAILSPDEVVNVTAFVHTLKGTKPEGAKPPQGEKVKAGTE